MSGGVVFLPSYYAAIRPLPDHERLALYDAILDYGITGAEPDGLPPLLAGYFALVRPNIDSSTKRYKSSVENGKKGGRPKKEPTENPTETQTEPTENLDKDKEKDSEREYRAGKPPTRPRPERKRFIPPTVEQVAEYVKQRGSKVDPQGFIDFYESKGWMIGKTPMKDWRAACRNAEHWERWEKKPVDTRNTLKTAADYDRGEDFFSC